MITFQTKVAMSPGNMSCHPFVQEGVFSVSGWSHRIIEYSELERMDIVHNDFQSLIPGPAQDNPKNPTMYLRALSKCSLLSVSLGAVTTALGSLLQCPDTLWVKSIFPKSFSSDFLLSLSAQNRGQGTWMGRRTELFRPRCGQGERCFWNPNSSPSYVVLAVGTIIP